MPGKAHTPEQIIHKLRQAEVEISKGATIPQAARKIGVTEQNRQRQVVGLIRTQFLKRFESSVPSATSTMRIGRWLRSCTGPLMKPISPSRGRPGGRLSP